MVSDGTNCNFTPRVISVQFLVVMLGVIYLLLFILRGWSEWQSGLFLVIGTKTVATCRISEQ